MKHTFFYLVASVLFLNCGNSKKETKIETKTETTESTTSNSSKIGRNNYAVVWKWETKDVQLVADNSKTISKELNDLWKADFIENAYYNATANTDKLAYFPNISFFIKANSQEHAKKLLNTLSVVKKGISSYKLYPVGNLWLDRKKTSTKDHGLTKSFVSIWSAKTKPTDEQKILQSETVLEYWNAGKLENVYFDIEGTQKANNVTDFVFFVNAETEEKAKALCESLPFYKEDIASYKMQEVGVFWMGINENN